ncbi:rhomboid family intramembrane serine protease [bacterium]|nr:rhomboid family intramembrane serine protease [bacterium]
MQRQTEGSTLCPSCHKLVSVNADVCPHCGAKRPGLFGFGPALSRLFGSQLDPIRLITVFCIGIYLVSLAIDLRWLTQGMSGGMLGILSPTWRALVILGGTQPADLVIGRPWTMLTAIYLHGGLLHIVFNMMWVRNLAPPVGQVYGPARFFLIWTIAGAVGFLASDGLPLLGLGDARMSVGASGSIFGLMAALIIYGRATGQTMMTRQLVTWAVVLGAMGFILPGVDNMAHIGGFAGGWISASLLRRPLSPAANRRISLAAVLLGALTLAGFVVNVGQALSYYLGRG